MTLLACLSTSSVFQYISVHCLFTFNFDLRVILIFKISLNFISTLCIYCHFLPNDLCLRRVLTPIPRRTVRRGRVDGLLSFRPVSTILFFRLQTLFDSLSVIVRGLVSPRV